MTSCVILTIQNRLLELGKELTPGAEWTVKPGSAAEMAKEAKEAFSSGDEQQQNGRGYAEGSRRFRSRVHF